ncbi:MAG: hypothetical protein IPJ13_17660 [Saprospiraceae bacterium]|nr:hypothetical protein [Saprospiraceae bacterium]
MESLITLPLSLQQPALRAKSPAVKDDFLPVCYHIAEPGKVGSQIEVLYKRFDGFTKHSSVNMLNLNAKIFR